MPSTKECMSYTERVFRGINARIISSVAAAPMIRKMGRVRVSFELLEDLLGIPKDIHITNVYRQINFGTVNDHVFDIVLEGDNLPQLTEGAEIPIINIQEVRGWDV